MKIIGLSIDGARKLTAFEMKDLKERGLIKIVGGNRQGKSTVFDCLRLLIKKGESVPKDFIQHGKDKAEIIGKIGEYTVTETIKDGSVSFTVVDSKGMAPRNPKSFVSELVNELTFDPRPFLNKTSTEKWKFMLELFGVDLSEIDKEINSLETERTLKGREVKAIGEVVAVPETNPVDISKIVAFNDEQRNRKATIDKANIQLFDLVAEKAETNERIEELEVRIAGLKEAAQNLELRIAKGEKYIETLPKPESLQEITAASEQNQKAAAYQEYLKKKADKEAKETEYREYTKAIEHLRTAKLKKLTEIKIPVPGLEIREDGIFHDGTHCENWSDEQSVTISSQLCLAMNPKLKAVFIDQGETYDSASLKKLEAWAVENDIQAFITIVDDIPDSKDDDTFYIVEGQLVK